MTVPGKELEDEAAGRRTRDEGIGVRVLRVDGLATRPVPLPQPPDTSRPRRQPRKVQGAGPALGQLLPKERPGADAAATAPAQARGVRRLVRLVPVIRPACLRTVLGLARQHAALMCGPGPGAPVGVQK